MSEHAQLHVKVANGQLTAETGYFVTPPDTGNPQVNWVLIEDAPEPEYDPRSHYLRINLVLMPNGTVQRHRHVKAKPVHLLRQEWLRKLQGEYEALLLEGFPVPGRDYRLALESADRNAFNQLFSTLQFAVQQGIRTPADIVVIADNRRQAHEETVADVFSILVQYADFYQALWEKIARANTALTQAGTVEAIVVVELNPTAPETPAE